tara:strand:- start:519 stop:707 length:189 start_codon:yes stop_codon:yes gene_type:complete
MDESTYIRVQNLTRIRIAQDIIGEVMRGDGIDADTLCRVGVALEQLRVEAYKAVSELDPPQD